MNRYELYGRLLTGLPSLPTVVTRVLFKYLPDKKSFTEQDYNRMEERVLAEAASEPRKPTTQMSKESVDLAYVFHRLQPEIEAIRESLLGGVNPLSHEEAADWIVEHVFFSAVSAEPEKWSSVDYILINYPGAKSAKACIPLCAGTSLYDAVNDAVKPMASKTGLDESDILSWVLRDIRPQVPRGQIHNQSPQSFREFKPPYCGHFGN